jgi:ABC-type phosphate transport system substrate-binding protein
LEHGLRRLGPFNREKSLSWKEPFMRFKKAFLLVISILFVFSTTAHAKKIAIVVSKKSPITRVSQAMLIDIYLGQKEVAGNVRLKPIDQGEGQEIRATFLRKVLGMSHEAYVKYWNRHLFQEGGIPPALKSDSKEVIRAVKEREGAIGYVWSQEAEAEDVRVLLTVDP